jgi:nucleotide-binding universal stress UspA family protein
MTARTPIIVGIQGGGHDDAAVSYALRVAARTGGDVRLVHAIQPIVDASAGSLGMASGPIIEARQAERVEHERMLELATASARRQAGAMHLTAVAMEPTVVEQDPGRALCDAAGMHRIVIGRDDERFNSWWHGSVGRSVLHHARGPVTIVPSSCTTAAPPDLPLLVATDGSPTSHAALCWAAEAARDEGRRLLVAHVWDYPYIGMRTAITEPADLMEEDARDLVERDIAALRDGVGDQLDIQPLVLRGDVIGRLVDASAAASEVVVGAHGRGGFTSMVLGSVSRGVAGHAIVPVTVIRRREF